MTMKPSSRRDWAEESRSFDSVADLYDAHRPGYPQELADAILSLTGVQHRGRIPDVGSGTGRATKLFARRGLSLHCIEPGEHLASVAGKERYMGPPSRLSPSILSPQVFG
jgi:SAM-dependent methyltransferase